MFIVIFSKQNPTFQKQSVRRVQLAQPSLALGCLESPTLWACFPGVFGCHNLCGCYFEITVRSERNLIVPANRDRVSNHHIDACAECVYFHVALLQGQIILVAGRIVAQCAAIFLALQLADTRLQQHGSMHQFFKNDSERWLGLGVDIHTHTNTHGHTFPHIHTPTHTNTHPHTHILSLGDAVLQCVAVCCSVLHCVTMYCSVLHQRTGHQKHSGKDAGQGLLLVCCNVLQFVAVCGSVLQCVAICCCSVLQCVVVCCIVLQSVALRCSVLQHAEVCWRVLQCVAVCCSVMQCGAKCFQILQCVVQGGSGK